MKTEISTASFVSGAAIFALAQIAAWQWCEIGSLKRELRLHESAKMIADDQIRELEMNVNTLTSERDSVAEQSFVRGVIEAFNKPNYYNSVWHDGYNNAMQVQKYVTSEEPAATP